MFCCLKTGVGFSDDHLGTVPERFRLSGWETGSEFLSWEHLPLFEFRNWFADKHFGAIRLGDGCVVADLGTVSVA